MERHRTKAIISILMESPLYLYMSLKERRLLLDRLVISYPDLCLADGDNPEEEAVGYESSWFGIS